MGRQPSITSISTSTARSSTIPFFTITTTRRSWSGRFPKLHIIDIANGHWPLTRQNPIGRLSSTLATGSTDTPFIAGWLCAFTHCVYFPSPSDRQNRTSKVRIEPVDRRLYNPLSLHLYITTSTTSWSHRPGPPLPRLYIMNTCPDRRPSIDAVHRAVILSYLVSVGFGHLVT